MGKTLKENIKEYYEEYQLSSRQELQLQNILKRRFTSNTTKFKFRATWAQVAVAASLLALVFVVVTPPNRSTSMDELITEIAYNHNKNLDVEIESSSIAEVRKYLSKLDFYIIDSASFSHDTWSLIGGRYCSLKGQLAAQLKLQNKLTQKYYTVYQLKIPLDITDVARFSETFESGVKVNLWLERGLLLALAGEK